MNKPTGFIEFERELPAGCLLISPLAPRRGERVWVRGKPQAGFALLLLLSTFGAPAFGDATPVNVKDPYQYVWDDEGRLTGMTRFFLKINGKSPALFLAANSLIGNGGGPFHVFLPNGDSYKNLGEIFSQPGGLEILPTRHQGIHDLKTCTHIGGGKYDCKTYSFNGKSFGAGTSKEIPQDRFSTEIKPTPVKIERSGPQLKWTTSANEQPSILPYRMHLLWIADARPRKYLFMLGDRVCYQSFDSFKDAVRRLPKGAILEWDPGCDRMEDEPLNSSHDIEEFKTFCEKSGVKLVIKPSG